MKISRHPSGSLFTTLSVNGKKNFIYGSTEEEVETKYTEMKYKHNKGYDVNNNPTMESYMVTWYKTFKAGKGALKTQEMYQNCINNHINPAIGTKKIKDITGTQVQTLLNKIKSSKSLAHKVRITMNQIFNQAIADRLITFNPVSSTKVIAPNKPKRACLSTTQRGLLLTILKDHELYPLILTILHTGMRMTEALALTWKDIDFENYFIKVTKGTEYKNGKPNEKDTKNEKHRNIPVPDQCVMDTIRKLKKTNKQLYVFPSEKGGPMNGYEVERKWKHAKKVINAWFKVNEKMQEHKFNLTFRLLRHTYCTALFDAEIDDVSAAYLMGHDISIMRGVYTHISNTREVKTIKKLKTLYKD